MTDREFAFYACLAWCAIAALAIANARTVLSLPGHPREWWGRR